MLVLIAAINNNGTIGDKGQMPWRNSEDFKHFKRTTMGHTIVMGRKTVEGIPQGLPGRKVLVVSRREQGPHVIQDFKQFLIDNQYTDEVIYIAGGAEIYKQSLPFAKKILLSLIHDNDVKGDTQFPEFNEDEFPIVSQTDFPTFTLIEREKL